MKKYRRCFLFCISILVSTFHTFAQEPPFGKGSAQGTIENRELKEASGITASIINPGLLWTHNDSGDVARIFLIDDSAKHKALYYLQGVDAYDWEEIASMQKNGSYLLIADIGDNKGVRPFVSIHIIKEPKLRQQSAYVDTIPANEIISFNLMYEDGARDAESFFYDEIDEKLYIITKRELQVGLYATELPLEKMKAGEVAKTLQLKKMAVLPFSFITSAAISGDGSEVLIKNLLEVFYWKRNGRETIPELLNRPTTRLPYKPEIQGEAITFALDGSGYYTLSEAPFGYKVNLMFYCRR